MQVWGSACIADTVFPSAVNLAVHYMDKKASSEGAASRGLIICTASNAGLYPLPVAPLYAASKFGVVGLVRSTARVIEKAGMQINALAPAVLGMFEHLCFVFDWNRG